MPDDLPIYSDIPLRTGLQFAELERLKGAETSGVWMRSDELIASLEGAAGAAMARESLTAISSEELLRAHGLLFLGREGAGRFRTTSLQPLYRGQDCAPPEFIERSVANLAAWLDAESFSQIHPVEQCALTISRIVDVWPFEFGNLTTAVVCGNLPLKRAGLTPFFVPPEYRAEFERTIAQAMTIDMQPLVNAIYRTVRKEMETLARE